MSSRLRERDAAILDSMERGRRYTAHELGTTLVAMNRLRRLGYVNREHGPDCDDNGEPLPMVHVLYWRPRR